VNGNAAHVEKGKKQRGNTAACREWGMVNEMHPESQKSW
jgi:hypothetical protein